MKKNYHSRYISTLGWFGMLTGIPTFLAGLGKKLGYNEFAVFFISLCLLWIGSIEFRLKDLGVKKNGK